MDAQKQTFLQHITHELKSPLAAIIETEALLSDQVPGSLNEPQKQVLGILRRDALNLRELIQQLLNYNAVKHSLSPDSEEVELRRKCEKYVDGCRPRSADKNITWEICGENATVLTDSRYLEMIANNLLSNAIKAAPVQGNIRISW